MPRRPRIENPGGFFHVAARGVDRTPIFRDPDDRLELLSLLNTILVRYQWRCQSYCLMGTHFHLVVQTLEPTLSRGMQALCGIYGQRFNKRHGRRGHLFGGRFAAAAITSDRHLLAAHRYVLRNPATAGLCAGPADWRWSSFRAVLGLDPAFQFLDIVGLLELFDPRPAVAVMAFRRLVEDSSLKPAVSYKLAEVDGV